MSVFGFIKGFVDGINDGIQGDSGDENSYNGYISDIPGINENADPEELRQYKQESYYHFSVPFEYIKTNYVKRGYTSGDEYEIETAYMEVDVDWNDEDAGYEVSNYECLKEASIDPNEGNGDIDEFYFDWVRDRIIRELMALDIPRDAILV